MDRPKEDGGKPKFPTFAIKSQVGKSDDSERLLYQNEERLLEVFVEAP
jgi:hypothetical protein